MPPPNPHLIHRVTAAVVNTEREGTIAAESLRAGNGACLEIGGGVVGFCGVDSPLTQALGLGVGRELTADELDALEAFYREHSAPAVVEVNDVVDHGLRAALEARGFMADHQEQVLLRPLAADEQFPVVPYGLRVWRAPPKVGRLWARILAQGFTDGASPPLTVQAGLIDLGLNFFSQTSAVPFLAGLQDADDSGAAGGGSVSLHGGVALLSSTAVIPRCRGMGLHAALLHARLAHARAAGCDLAVTYTQPGSGSQRNCERAGFTPAWTVTVMTKTML